MTGMSFLQYSNPAWFMTVHGDWGLCYPIFHYQRLSVSGAVRVWGRWGLKDTDVCIGVRCASLIVLDVQHPFVEFTLLQQLVVVGNVSCRQ